MGVKALKKLQKAVSVTSVAMIFLCGCQQIDSIESQREDIAEFSQLDLQDKNAMIEEWAEMISLDKINKSDSHCCYIRYQHALKNLVQLIRESNYRKNNRIHYERIIQEYFRIANTSTHLNFMTDCMEDNSGIDAEITNIRKVAISSLIALEDQEIFQFLLKEYSSSNYEPDVQLAITDGLIKYLPEFKNDDICAKLIVKSMILKSRYKFFSEKKATEHLIGMSTSLSSLNEAIRQSKNNVPIIELVLELNLNFWRKTLKENLEFNDRDALENIALLKDLAMSSASPRVDELVYFTLCEIVPAESLVVLNMKMEREQSFNNMKNMLLFYHSLSKINITNNAKLNKLTNTDKAIKTCKKLAKEFLQERVSSLPIYEQKETYEIYARNLPDQVYDFLISRFIKGEDSISFYENAVNTALWLGREKIYTGDQLSKLNNSVDKLLFSCRRRTDYKKIFEIVFANKTSYFNQWQEMKNSAAKSDVVQKDAFTDSFVTLISKIKTGKNIPSDFAVKNREVFEYIIATMDTPAILKLVPYLERSKEQKFLLEKYFINAFDRHKLNTSVAHLSIAGDLAARYTKDLKENEKLYDAYKKLFLDGIADKDENVSLLCADYYFRIIHGNEKDIEQGKKVFSRYWPNLRPVVQNKKN